MMNWADELKIHGPERVEKQRVHVGVEPESRAEPKLKRETRSKEKQLRQKRQTQKMEMHKLKME